MLKRCNIVITAYLLAFLFFQAQAYDYVSHKAATSATRQSCCNNSEASSPTEKHDKKNCCCNATHGDSNDCSGNCGDYTCQSFPHAFYTAPLIIKEAQNKFIRQDGRHYSLYQQPPCTSGFSSIWRPPQIG